jgi:hypothetical protein
MPAENIDWNTSSTSASQTTASASTYFATSSPGSDNVSEGKHLNYEQSFTNKFSQKVFSLEYTGELSFKKEPEMKSTPSLRNFQDMRSHAKLQIY